MNIAQRLQRSHDDRFNKLFARAKRKSVDIDSTNKNVLCHFADGSMSIFDLKNKSIGVSISDA